MAETYSITTAISCAAATSGSGTLAGTTTYALTSGGGAATPEVSTRLLLLSPAEVLLDERPASRNGSYSFAGLADGAYLLQWRETETDELLASGGGTVSCAGGGGGTDPGNGGGGATPIDGCTDAAATNYDADATVENGSCAYAPPAPLPAYFAVPLLQTLRFVLRGALAPAGPDGTLFCEQPRPGQQRRPWFYQPVASADVVRVQVLTSYAAVTATISRHGGGPAAPAVALQPVLTLEGNAPPLAVELSQDVATGTTRLGAPGGGALPPGLLAAARLTLTGAVAGTYRLTQAVPGSAVQTSDYVVFNRPWVAPAAGAVTVSWRLSGPGFNVWEAELPVAALAAGYYQVQLRGTQAGWVDAVADSEPIHVRAQHGSTLALDYRNADNCFGTVFSTGLTPRLRVPGTFFRQKNGGGASTYRDSAGTLTVLGSTAQRLLTLETYALPAWLHEKLFLACRLDFLQVEGVRCQTDQAYEVSEERAYPLAGGRVTLEQSPWLGAGNGHDVGVEETAPDNALQLRSGEYLLLRG